MDEPKRQMEFEVLGQVLKGMLAGLGIGNGLTTTARTIASELITRGMDLPPSSVLNECAASADGDILVVASKVVAISESRVWYPKETPPPLTMANIGTIMDSMTADGIEADERDVVMLDHVAPGPMWTLGLSNPNASAKRISNTIRTVTGKVLDVVISDSAAGVAKGGILVGCTTFVATAIGATAGVEFVQAQRCAAAAEVGRNAVDSSPFVLIHSDLNADRRPRIGGGRYDGYLNAAAEDPSTIPQV
jgi:hypothetical protein